MASTLIIPAELQNLASLRCFVEESAKALQADNEAVEDMVLAVDEAATNIIVHGYRGQPGTIEARISIDEKYLSVRLCDQAPLFDPTEIPPPDLSLPLEHRRFGGLGIYLARQFMDEVKYCVNPEGCNELTLLRSARERRPDSGDRNATS